MYRFYALNDRRRTLEGKLQHGKFRKAAVKAADENILLKIREEQIELLGGCESLFNAVDYNLRRHSFSSDLAVPQYKLYEWREQFFHTQHPDNSWFTDWADDAHYFDTIPYQITKNWIEVVALSCSPFRKKRRIFFENYECASAARQLYDKSYILDSLDYGSPGALDYFIEDGSLGDMAYTLDALFSPTPPKLEHIALRSCLWNEIDLSEVPWALDKAFNGFYDFSNPDLSHLTIEGKDIFKKWREAVGKRVAMEGQEEEIEGSTFVDDDHTDEEVDDDKEEEELDFDHIDVDNDEESEEMDERKYIEIMSEKFQNLERTLCTEAGEESVTKEDNIDLENDEKYEEMKGRKEIEIQQVKETFNEEPKCLDRKSVV